jgi:hypothetical protein
MGARQPVVALAAVGLILVLSLPFLLFAFVTTLLNHIEFEPVASPQAVAQATGTLERGQTPAQALS